MESAFDGVTGLEMAVNNHFDAILLDVMLPKMDGFEVLRQLREAGNVSPIIMLTARASTEDKVKGLDYGADDYLPKPFSFDELAARSSFNTSSLKS